MKYVRPKIARDYLGITNQTLQIWGDEGRIHTIRGRGGHRLYDLDGFIKKEASAEAQTDRKRYIYCRVSSGKQKEDLERQVQYLSEKYPTHIVIREIASGINFKRKALQRLLDEITRGTVEEVVVAHRDRLCRIAYEHFIWLFEKYGTTVVVDSEHDRTASAEQELAEDLLSIVHVFSSRHYGQRRKYTKREVQEDTHHDVEEARGTESS